MLKLQLKKLQQNRFLQYLPLLPVIPQILLLISYYSHWWLSDIYVSFSPYIFVGSVILLLVSAIFIKNTYHKVFFILALILTLVNAVPAYNWLYMTNYSHRSNGDIKIASLNKLYTNKNLDRLSKDVSSEKYDIVGMSEVPKSHYETLKKSWRYSVSADCKCDPSLASELVIFSKYPIENAEVISAGEDKGGMLRAEFMINKKPLIVYVAHPPAPVNMANYQQRRKVLSEFIAPRLRADKDKAAIFMGDLNLSVYSQNYKEFDSSISGYDNILQGTQDYKTWCFAGLDFICAPIDQMFVTHKLSASKPEIIPIEGTDHDLLSTEIVLK
jgi:endonuclease/exonuclease/phosphatase (EEP) superfamily protein YafD